MSKLGTLPIHVKKNWQEWVSTLTHAYNATMCHATGFSPFFLMYGRIPILPIDVEFGVTYQICRMQVDKTMQKS